MKRFHFNLEALATLRGWEEQRCQRALGEATREIERLDGEIRSLEGAKERACQGWSAKSQAGSRFGPRDRQALQSELSAIDELSGQMGEALRKAEERRMKAIEALKQAARAKQAVENLKEKRMEAFRSEYYRQEAREIEDIFNSRHRRRAD